MDHFLRQHWHRCMHLLLLGSVPPSCLCSGLHFEQKSNPCGRSQVLLGSCALSLWCQLQPSLECLWCNYPAITTGIPLSSTFATACDGLPSRKGSSINTWDSCWIFILFAHFILPILSLHRPHFLMMPQIGSMLYWILRSLPSIWIFPGYFIIYKSIRSPRWCIRCGQIFRELYPVLHALLGTLKYLNHNMW